MIESLFDRGTCGRRRAKCRLTAMISARTPVKWRSASGFALKSVGQEDEEEEEEEDDDDDDDDNDDDEKDIGRR